MSILKTAALAAAFAGGMLATAEAQPYGHWGQGYGHYGYHRQAPVYVDPRFARKQARLSERFVEKYGYVQPQYGYRRQHYWDGHPQYARPVRPQTYYYGW